jgi:hypothetical protein
VPISAIHVDDRKFGLGLHAQSQSEEKQWTRQESEFEIHSMRSDPQCHAQNLPFVTRCAIEVDAANQRSKAATEGQLIHGCEAGGGSVIIAAQPCRAC